MISFTIPLRTNSGNDGHGRENHWARAKRVERERKATALMFRTILRRRVALGHGLTMFGSPMTIKLTRIKPRGKDLDAHDNLPNSMKAVVDQIAAELGVDDGDTTRVRWEYGQTRGPWGIRVEIS